MALAALHDGRFLAGRSLGATTRTLLRAGSEVQHLGPFLIADALLEHSGSGNQAFERVQEAEVLPVSITSAYDKLGKLPLAVSETLLLRKAPRG